MWVRILTALLLAPAAILGTLYLPNFWFALLLLLVLALALFEWISLCTDSRAAGLVSLLTFVLAAWLLFGHDEALVFASLAGTIFWVLQGLKIIRSGLGNKIVPTLCAVQGCLAVVAAWSGLTLLQRQPDSGPVLALFLLLLIWSADSLAYFTGRQFGRRKLAPTISPGKTVEGMLGGMAGVLLLALAAGLYYFHFSSLALAYWLAIALISGLFSVLGDLAESRLKRLAGVKDSGTLLPGHGGVLDRVDALLAAVPAFALLLLVGQRFGFY